MFSEILSRTVPAPPQRRQLHDVAPGVENVPEGHGKQLPDDAKNPAKH